MPDKLQSLEEKLFLETDGEKFDRLKNRLIKQAGEERQRVLDILMRYIREGQLLHWREFLVPELVRLTEEGERACADFFAWCITRPELAYWAVDGLLKTSGVEAYPALVALVGNTALETETRAKAVKELALHSGQSFDRGLSSDPGYWKEEQLRLEELLAWQQQGYPRGSGYPQPPAHSSLQNPETELEQAAARLHQRLERERKKNGEDPANPAQRLTPAEKEDMERIRERWQLPENYLTFLARYSPLRVHLATEFCPQGISLYGAQELIRRQQGYSYNPVEEREIEDWPQGYVVIADSGGDPFCIDTRQIQGEDAPVYSAEHGMGSWDFEEYAASFLEFLKELC